MTLNHPAAAFTLIMTAALLSVWGVSDYFAERIEKNRADKRQRLVAAVLSDVRHDNDVPATTRPQTAVLPTATVRALSFARADGRLVAVVVRASARRGYGGAIELMLGVHRDGRRTVRVLRHSETPGIADFLADDGAQRVFDGVSGATITATALVRAADDVAAWLAACVDWESADPLSDSCRTAR